MKSLNHSNLLTLKPELDHEDLRIRALMTDQSRCVLAILLTLASAKERDQRHHLELILPSDFATEFGEAMEDIEAAGLAVFRNDEEENVVVTFTRQFAQGLSDRAA